MEPNAPQTETLESFWSLAAFYAFAALLIGAAVLLAIGVAPAWAEWIAAAFLWALVSLVYLLLVGSFLMTLGPLRPYMRPASPKLQNRRGRGRKPRHIRYWVRYLAQRLLQLVFLAALVISGRPVLAGLYFLVFFTITALQVRLRMWLVEGDRPDVSAGQWVVYQTFCLPFQVVYTVWRLLRCVAKWCLWIPFLTAVLACLSHAGIRIKRPLRESLGLPRTLAGFLYVLPWRRFWTQILPLCFWLSVTSLALGLAFGALPMAAEEAMIAILWGTALSLLTLSGLSFLFLVFVEDGGNVIHRRPPLDWPREFGFYAHFLLGLVFLSALCGAGQWALAGLYLALICVVSAIEWYGTLTDGQDDEILNPSIVTGVTGLLLLLGPFLVLVAPVFLPILAYESWSKIRTAKDLRRNFDKPGGLIYFLYSEPHQYEHFLGEGGVLAAYGDQVVARNWRTCIRPKREGQGWEDYEESAEGRLLEHFEISRLRHHLPFVVVIPPNSWLKDFQMSKVYRARRNDNGRALRELEEQIKSAANKAFDIAAT